MRGFLGRVRVRVWIGERGSVVLAGMGSGTLATFYLPYGTQEDWTFRRLLTWLAPCYEKSWQRRSWLNPPSGQHQHKASISISINIDFPTSPSSFTTAMSFPTINNPTNLKPFPSSISYARILLPPPRPKNLPINSGPPRLSPSPPPTPLARGTANPARMPPTWCWKDSLSPHCQQRWKGGVAWGWPGLLCSVCSTAMDGRWAVLVGGGQRRRDSWEWVRGGGGGGGRSMVLGAKELAVRETVSYARDIGGMGRWAGW